MTSIKKPVFSWKTGFQGWSQGYDEFRSLVAALHQGAASPLWV